MHRIFKDISVNLIGKLLIATLSILTVPIYVGKLGIEAFGLIGFYSTLLMVLSFFDLGLSASLTRELSKIKIVGGRRVGELVATLEILSWILALIAAALVIGFSNWLATNFLGVNTLPHNELIISIQLMGFVILCQLLTNFYNSGIIGLQNYGVSNFILVLIAIFRYIGSIAIIYWYSNSLIIFFIWQAVVACFGTILLRIFLKRHLGANFKYSGFSFKYAYELKSFSFGVAGIGITSILILQIDKLAVSSLLSLKDFGYYSLACTITGSLLYLTQPIFSTFLPKITYSISSDDVPSTVNLYRLGSQVMSFMVVPPGVLIFFFSKELIYLWTGSEEIAIQAYKVLSLLVIGGLTSAIMNMPYALQLSSGWVSLTFKSNFIGAIFLIPFIYFSTLKFGGEGAALAYSLFVLIQAIIIIIFMHKRLLKNHLASWVVNDIMNPILLSIGFIWLCKLAFPLNHGKLFDLVLILTILLATQFLLILSLPELRKLLLKYIF